MKGFLHTSKLVTQQANHARKRSVSRDGLTVDAASSRTAEFVDNLPEAIAHRKLQAMMNQSLQVQRQAQLQATIDNTPRQVATEVTSQFTEKEKKAFLDWLEEQWVFEIANDYVWDSEYEGADAGKQSQWLSHIHIFKEMSAKNFEGQVTVRNKESDEKGVKFNGLNPEVTADEIRAEVFRKFGREQEGRENRDKVVKGLKSLFDGVKKYWQRWAHMQSN